MGPRTIFEEKVGIGTTNTPMSSLQVNGDLFIGNTGYYTNWPVTANIQLEPEGIFRIGPWELTHEGGGTQVSYLRIDRWTVDNTGQKKKEHIVAFDYAGKFYAKEVRATLGGPLGDFVFDDDYDLKSLEEVENYIKENHHLPDVPSEQEVKENGLNLGEMNAVLLQKVEELTLYIIKQDKEIKCLKKYITKK